jgi:hypothetical protein
MYSVKPPTVLIRTWLEIYYSQTITNNHKAQTAVEHRILESFDSLYGAEMYLHELDQVKLTR